MTTSNLRDKNELEIQMQKRIAELEKANQDLQAEILECKKADETLNRERSLLESVTQTTDVMLVYLDPQFNFLWVNPAYAKTCRMKPEELVGKNHFALYPHEENEEIFRKVRDTGEGVFYKDKPFFFSDQPKRGVTYWDWSLAPVKNSAGNVTGLVFSLRETTKYKQMEDLLALERSQLLSIFDGMEDAVYVTDPYTYEILYTNKAMKDKFGGKLDGEICYHEFQKRDLPCDFCTNQIILKEKGRPYHWEYYNSLIKRHFIIMDRIIKWPDGRDVRLEIAKDITELKKAKEALQENEMALNRLYESGMIGVFHYTLDGQITDANDKFLEIVGYEREDLKAGNIGWQQMTPQEYHDLDLQAINELKETGVSKPYEKEYFRKDGSRIPIILGAASINNDLHKGLAFVLNNTDQKRAEIKLKETLNNLDKLVKIRTAELEKAYISLKESKERLADAQRIAHIGSYDWNIMTNEEFWSDEMYHIFGLDPKTKINHNVFLSFIHPKDLGRVSHVLNEALKGKPYSIDYKVTLSSGKERVVYSQGGVIFDEKNTPIRMRGIVQDITEYKKAEEALANIEIARKKEIHHRIKNNLQIISSLLDLQAGHFKNRENIKDSEVLEAFKESQDRVSSIALIHEELHEDGETEALNMSLYINRLADNLLNTYRLRNPEITLNSDIKKDIFFDMDTAVPLGMIINELITNSLKYAFPDRRAGEINIKLFSEAVANNMKNKGELFEKGNRYTLIVSDNGIGIPNEVNLKNTGTLGLQLVTILVEQLDGKIEVKRDIGTEFIFKFNVAEKEK